MYVIDIDSYIHNDIQYYSKLLSLLYIITCLIL